MGIMCTNFYMCGLMVLCGMCVQEIICVLDAGCSICQDLWSFEMFYCLIDLSCCDCSFCIYLSMDLFVCYGCVCKLLN